MMSRNAALLVLCMTGSALAQQSDGSPEAALAARVAGLRVVTISGRPGSAPELILRAASIHRVTAPLIVIDGVVSRGPLHDLDIDDIETVDVLKGAAMAAHYGLGAANGVVIVTTKRGAPSAEEGTSFTWRSEVSQHRAPRRIPSNQHHAFQMNAAGTDFAVDGSGNRIPEADDIHDNEYPLRHDARAALFAPGLLVANHLTAQLGRRATTGFGNLFASFHHERDAGTFTLLNGYHEKSARLTLDRPIGKGVSLDGRVFAFDSDNDHPSSTGSMIAALTMIEPHAKLDSIVTAPACFVGPSCYVPAVPAGRFFSGLFSFPNPLYTLQHVDLSDARNRFVGGINATYRPREWLSAHIGYTSDKITARSVSRSVGISTARDDVDQNISTTTATVSATRQLTSAVWSATSLGWLRENRRRDEESRIESSNGTFSARSSHFRARTSSGFATAKVDFGRGLNVEAALRRDEPSMFGEGNHGWYHRLGASFNPIGSVRLHAAHGTSAVALADETAFSVSVAPSFLHLPFVRETEMGVTAALKNGMTATIDLAHQRTVGYVALVPIPSSLGFDLVYRNIADVVSNSQEIAVGVPVFDAPGLEWRVDIVGHRTRSEFDRFVSTPMFLTGPNFMLLAADGVELGTVVGTLWIRSEAQLLETIRTGALSGTAADYVRNEEGYYVRATQHRTPNEVPLAHVRCAQPGGTGTCSPATLPPRLGLTRPDFEWGLRTTGRWKSVALHATLTGAVGGIIYNANRRPAIAVGRDAVVDQSAKPVAERKPGAYYRAFLLGSDYYVESATHAKVRDLALEWEPGPSFLSRMRLGRAHGSTIGIVARNMWTSGSYSGHDPDVAVPDGNFASRNVETGLHPAPRTIGVRLKAAL